MRKESETEMDREREMKKERLIGEEIERWIERERKGEIYG